LKPRTKSQHPPQAVQPRHSQPQQRAIQPQRSQPQQREAPQKSDSQRGKPERGEKGKKDR
jgi:hypothetical protein